MIFALIVPTYNAGDSWRAWLTNLSMQSITPASILIIDSSSTDETVDLAKQHGLDVVIIPQNEFNHAGTRNRAVNLIQKADVLVFMTQDAFLADSRSLEMLTNCFSDPDVAAVYGRQLPHKYANPVACHARIFNYGAYSFVRDRTDITRYGIKTAFMSNSFAAYRTSVFHELGGFPESTILAEDMYLTARILLAGYKVAYCAEAAVYHSHNYSLLDEFRRYFDTGVFHANEPWLQEKFSGAGGEGLRYVRSEFSYLWKNNVLWIPRSLLSNACKLLGYKMGKHYNLLPNRLLPKLSMFKSYWLQQK